MASELLATGDVARALERAGEAVYLDPERPEGFVLLGDIHLAGLDPEEALTAFEVGHEKALRLRDEGQVLAALALSGQAKAHFMCGRLEAATLPLERLLADHPEDGGGAVSILAQAYLESGRSADCRRVLAAHPDRLDSGLHLIEALVELRDGRHETACLAARRAYLANLHLLGALMEEETPDFGLTVGDDRGSRDAATDLAERLGEYFEACPSGLDDLESIADNEVVEAELLLALEAARALNRERDVRLRAEWIERLSDLRAEPRLLLSNGPVVAGLSNRG